MAYRETLPRRGIPRRQMMKRVAHFAKLKGFDGGLPDSRMPGCERILYNVIGFQPPKTERDGKQSPVGEAGTAGAPGAVMNAINDALAPLNARVTAMPFTPERILRALAKV